MKHLKTGRYFKYTAEKSASYTIQPKDEVAVIIGSAGNVAL
jgi:hypothetical protein